MIMNVRVRIYRRDLEGFPRAVVSQFNLEKGGMIEADHDVLFQDMEHSKVSELTLKLNCYRVKDQIMADPRTIKATVHELPMVFSL